MIALRLVLALLFALWAFAELVKGSLDAALLFGVIAWGIWAFEPRKRAQRP